MYEFMKIEVTRNNIHIERSCECSKRSFGTVLTNIRTDYTGKTDVLDHRTDRSMKHEWAVHNALYSLGLFTTRTESCDLEYPQKHLYALMYNIVGAIVWPFLK